MSNKTNFYKTNQFYGKVKFNLYMYNLCITLLCILMYNFNVSYTFGIFSTTCRRTKANYFKPVINTHTVI